MECPEICVNLKLLAEIEKKNSASFSFCFVSSISLYVHVYVYVCLYVYMYVFMFLFLLCNIYIYRYWLPGITMAVVQSPISASLGITTQVFLRDDPGLLLIGL